MDQPTKQSQFPDLSDRALLEEAYKNARAAKNYMKWQLIITVALVVIPLLGFAVMVPFIFKSLSSVYGAGLIQ